GWTRGKNRPTTLTGSIRPSPGRNPLRTSRKPMRRTMFTRRRENISTKKELADLVLAISANNGMEPIGNFGPVRTGTVSTGTQPRAKEGRVGWPEIWNGSSNPKYCALAEVQMSLRLLASDLSFLTCIPLQG